jgi:hypothetical protein
MARTDSTRSDDDVMDNEQSSDDVQNRVAQTTNEEPSAAIPIPTLVGVGDGVLTAADEDVERGRGIDDATAPLLGGGAMDAQQREGERQSVWRNISASVSRLSGDTLWRQTPVDRNR